MGWVVCWQIANYFTTAIQLCYKIIHFYGLAHNLWQQLSTQSVYCDSINKTSHLTRTLHTIFYAP